MDRASSFLRLPSGGLSPLWLAGLIAAALTACGGGGGGMDSTAAMDSSTAVLADPMNAPSRVPGALPRSFSARVIDATGQAGPGALNAFGQVAFTSTATGVERARFFDGHKVQIVVNDMPARAVALNDAGRVAGTLVQASGGSLVFSWDPSAPDTFHIIDSQPGPFFVAEGINAQGDIVGTTTNRGISRGFLWTPPLVFGRGLEPIGAAAGQIAQSFGRFINGAGAAAGASTVPNGRIHAAFWAAGVPPVDLGTFGGVDSFASGLNDANQVAGQADLMGGSHHAFLWSQSAGLRDLGTLGGASSSAVALNASGAVVGSAETSDGTQRAFFWQGSMQSLGTLGGTDSAATCINASNQVGGTAQAADGSQHAFLWNASDGMIDLNDRSVPANRGVLRSVIALGNDGTVLVSSDAGLVLLNPHGPPAR